MKDLIQSIPWFSPAFDGLSFRERNRLLRIARSGRAVEDPDDARIVCTLIRHQLAPSTPKEWVEELLLLIGIVAIVLFLGVPRLGWAWVLYQMSWVLALSGGFTWWVRRRFRSTLKATNCPEP